MLELLDIHLDLDTCDLKIERKKIIGSLIHITELNDSVLVELSVTWHVCSVEK